VELLVRRVVVVQIIITPIVHLIIPGIRAGGGPWRSWRGGTWASPSRGRWGVPTLSKKQVRYACVDAYLSYRQ
jgi:hypothetical protein